jgi:molybdate transport system substrate-binding protein
VTSLDILSGGAAQGLVGSLAPKFKALTGYDIRGQFGAIGVMANRLRNGAAADLVILTATLVNELAAEKLVDSASIADVGRVETALAVRAGKPLVKVGDAAMLRESLLAADAIFVPDTRTSTAGIHVARLLQQLGIAEQVSSRLKVFPNGATAMRELAASDATRAIGCTQSTEIIGTPGVALSGALPDGCSLSTVYTAAVATRALHRRQAGDLIGLLVAGDQLDLRQSAGFLPV